MKLGRIAALLEWLPKRKAPSRPPADLTIDSPAAAELPRKEGRALPLGYQYAGGCGARAQRRYLRQRCAPVYKLRDEDSIDALADIRAAVAMAPDPSGDEFKLISAALDLAERTGRSWASAAWRVLDELDELRAKVGA